MLTEFHPINANLRGILAISPRPRGGDWLDDEMNVWREAGIHHVVSLLTTAEASDLGLEEEQETCRRHSLEFTNFAIEDRSVPAANSGAAELVDSISEDLARGRNVLIHCRQGLGRAATIAAAVLIENGWTSDAAISRISQDRTVEVPETVEQRRWIENFIPARAPESSR